MASIANITVVNAASGNVVYVAQVASAGDRSAAVWKANALSAVPAFRPMFRMVTRDNGKMNGRIVNIDYSFPIFGTDTTTNQPFLVAKVPLRLEGTLPLNVDAAVVNDAFVQFGNLLVSTLVRTSIQEGYSPT